MRRFLNVAMAVLFLLVLALLAAGVAGFDWLSHLTALTGN